MQTAVNNEEAMKAFGAVIGGHLSGGEIIDLTGDVGAGKTTLTKGIAAGLGIEEDVQSPSFTISRVYDARNGLRLAHYDFYRLHNAGIMHDELAETVMDNKTVTIIEWSDVVKSVLPSDHISIHITSPEEHVRHLNITAHGELSQMLVEKLV
ncbi:MAG: tRNA (adenosine(37)-N6)-threonylcarbamoyltransferase complex ATPase subunit type 1 TsaE [Candidatus Saccharimonadales bacterium]